MKDQPKNKVCKNKNCQKPLPSDYKYKYCEACRNKRADKTKKVLKGIGAGAAAVGTVVLAIATKGKFVPKGK